jgi:streptomycin 6-kinase
MLSLPPELRQNVVGTSGQKGEQWLQQLPSIITEHEKKWLLHITQPEHKLNYNYVAPAYRNDGIEAIIKIGIPNPELRSEIETLTIYNGKKMVQLLKADPGAGVLLLERIRPGTPLTEVQQEDDKKATTIMAELIRDMSALVPKENNFPTLTQWFETFQRIRNEKIPSEFIPLIEKAEEIVSELEKSKSAEKLLHGDLHFENVLLDEKKGWIAIDPKGVIGDPVYETARLLHNPNSMLVKAKNPQEIVEKRIEILSSILKWDKERIAKWGYVDCVLASCWSIEDNQDYSEAVESIKIFQKILSNT